MVVVEEKGGNHHRHWDSQSVQQFMTIHSIERSGPKAVDQPVGSECLTLALEGKAQNAFFHGPEWAEHILHVFQKSAKLVSFKVPSG